jgi:2-amino-4-hydroxy-6-hydroxymethyldihydropteridine diphosphokinase
MDAWIGLGSNLGNPGAQLKAALGYLKNTPAIELRKKSGIYRSKPWGKLDQGDFLNAVVLLETGLEPEELLEVLMQIENRMGRDRSVGQWGPRVIDLDLLAYANIVTKTQVLELPHPRMHLRAFVLQPLLELDPDFLIAENRSARECLDDLDKQEIEYVGTFDQY